MKRTIVLLTLLGLVGAASAGTIAHWRFEEGTPGIQHTGDYDDFYADTSGNGNHLSAWQASGNPTATADLPFTSQGGTTNEVALDFDSASSQNIGTFGPGNIHDKPLDSYSFSNGWTIEATFKTRSYWWSVIIGKDGQPDAGMGESNLAFKIRDDSHSVECGFFDDATNWVWLATESLDLNRWYSLAATYDDASSTYNLYLKQQDGGDYVLQGTVTNITAGVALNLGTQYWTVGRGMWTGNPTDIFNGLIDEVRISDVALAPSEFINQDGFTIPFDIEKPGAVAAVGYIDWTEPFDLISSEYWSPSGEAFAVSDWQISTDDTFATLDWAANIGLPTITVPGGTLAEDTYYARVRYLSADSVSEWSDAKELKLVAAETVAYWTFDELGHGERHDTDNDGFYVDSSGRGNHMSSRLEKYRPVFLDDVFSGSESTNTASIKVGGGWAYYAEEAGVTTDSGAEINSYALTNGFTIEASFKLDAVADWMVIMGKDGKAWSGRLESPFFFKVAPGGNDIACFVARDDQTDADPQFDVITTGNVVAGKWYSIAATYNGAQFKLYLKSEDDADYVLQDSLDRTEGFSLGAWDQPWRIGQGYWDGHTDAIFNGLIDEVRISHGALPVSLLLGNIGTRGAYDMRSPKKAYLSNFTGLDSVMRLSSSEAFSPRGYTLANSEWKVASDTGMTDVVWESGLIAGKNYVDIPPYSLPALATYYVGVRYQASNGNWTDWSVAEPEFVDALAHWRFEEGANGAIMTTALDSSGNGNGLVWDTETPDEWGRPAIEPFATNAVPYSTVPQTWEDNIGALNVAGDLDYLRTDGSMINSYNFTNGWTIEATFMTAYSDAWQGIVSKRGKRTTGAEMPIRLFQRADTQKMEVLGVDDTGDEWYRVDANAVTETFQWYSMAATYDNKLVRLYVKGPGDSKYKLQASANVTRGASLSGWSRNWDVGVGFWDDHWADALVGLVDEVKITDGALEPGAFIADKGAGWDSDSNGMADVWEIDNFGAIGVDPSDDPDADGRDNLTEFLYGGDPNVADTGHATTYGAFDPGTGTNVFAYVYPRRKNPYIRGDSYSFETTDDLIYGSWTNDGSVVISGVGSIDAEFDAVTNQVPMDTDEKFIKRIVE